MDVAGLRKTFAARLRKLRDERGQNQGQFADSVGISRGAMSYYEQEARTPDIAVLKSICETCGVSADYMIGLIPDRNHAVSDVCLETGLSPHAVKLLSLINRFISEAPYESPEHLEEVFGGDTITVLNLAPFTVLPELMSFLFENEDGQSLLMLLGAIIMGAEFRAGSDDAEPRFILKSAVKQFELELPLDNLTAALWVNIQSHADTLKKKYQDGQGCQQTQDIKN